MFKNGSLYLEEVFQKSVTTPGSPSGKPLTAGQKAARSRKTGSYTIEQHFEGKPARMQNLARSVQEFLLGLDPSMEEAPKKYYVAYTISQNIACMEIQKQRVLFYVKLDPKTVEAPKKIARDVTNIGHYGTGALELSVRTSQDLELVKPLLEQAYQKIGG